MLFCDNCGQGNPDNVNFCIQCGEPISGGAASEQPQGAPPPGAAAPPVSGGGVSPPTPTAPQTTAPPGVAPVARSVPTDGLAVASLVLSIVSFLFCPIVAAVLGIIFGYISQRNIEESGGALGGDQLAMAGIIVGWVHLGLVLLAGIVFTILIVFGVAWWA